MTGTFLRATGLALAVAVTTLGAARADDKDKAEAKGDLAKLQGTWAGKVGPEKNMTVQITIDGSKCTAKLTTPDEQEFEVKGEVVVDETAKPHKTINWTKFTGPNGDDVPDNLGIYAFEGDDTVKFCNGGPGNERPTEFKAGEQGGPQLFELKREKAAKGDEKDKDKPAEAKGDLAKLQGDWTAKVGPDMDIDVTLTFKGDAVSIVVTRDGQERTMKASVSLEEDAKPHKAITFKGISRGDGTESPENLGIYTIEDADTVKVCTGGPGNERPTEFKAGDGNRPQLLTLKRKK